MRIRRGRYRRKTRVRVVQNARETWRARRSLAIRPTVVSVDDFSWFGVIPVVVKRLSSESATRATAVTRRRADDNGRIKITLPLPPSAARQ